MMDQIFQPNPFQLHERKVDVSRFSSVATKRSGILQSICACQPPQDPKDETELEKNPPELCKLCQITKSLPKLHGLPEMLFYENYVRLEHRRSGAAIEFNSIDALKEVEETRDPLQVAVADGWQSARSDFPFANRIHKPYDWTYTSSYKGTFKTNPLGDQQSGIIRIEETDERIDLEKLRKKEEILFYEDITLYEDELADHGVSKYSVKVRAMPSCIYMLARFYLRIDNVLVRINDTRIYHEYRKNYLIREYTNREASIKSLNLPLPTILEPNELMAHLPIIHTVIDKLIWPELPGKE